METILKKKLTVVAVAIVIVVIGFYLFFQPEDETAGTEDIFAASANEEMEEETKPEAESEPRIMKVDVKGAVRAPGVFTAQAGDRVIDLITEAGSFTDKADMDKVNLAQLVEDQMVIYVPKIGEEDVEGPANVATAPTGSMASSSTGGQVNLNAATQADLETLSGIGPSKATAILEYRETIGKFKQVEDLKNVSGIGDKTFEKLKDSITVQ
ncbi:helix-hairpin-helix domain-containing protein [Peribacillus sp. NPDC097284]|uniref:helix-hairpin-helix domain-containing protein n=1 Tax=Peribacillus sp. NPDC097284 TaxID=3364401 RepID=UPI003827F282